MYNRDKLMRRMDGHERIEESPMSLKGCTWECYFNRGGLRAFQVVLAEMLLSLQNILTSRKMICLIHEKPQVTESNLMSQGMDQTWKIHKDLFL